ncbi:hypothetical protein C8R46DRAFT_905848 [Mycena filopes]|nr:hypothetical protein C8R46DRAFT_905848 [Mycena filopes]
MSNPPSSPRIVSVFGATGTQGAYSTLALFTTHDLMDNSLAGSAVIRGILEDGTFTPRAITRDPLSEAARTLQAQGVEVVRGDALDKASLVAALRGSEAVFGVLPIHPLKAEGEGPNEIVQGKNMVDAAKEVGVKFFIFRQVLNAPPIHIFNRTSLCSSGPDIGKLTGGKYKSLVATDQKFVVDQYLQASGLPYASLLPGTFLENFWKYGGLKKTPTGFDIGMPIFKASDTNAFTWIGHDYPRVVLALLKNYDDPSKARGVLGRSYEVVTAVLTYGQIAALATKGVGAEVTFTSGPPTGSVHLDDMYKCLAEFKGVYTAKNPDLIALGVEFGTIEEFMNTELKSRVAKI